MDLLEQFSGKYDKQRYKFGSLEYNTKTGMEIKFQTVLEIFSHFHFKCAAYYGRRL